MAGKVKLVDGKLQDESLEDGTGVGDNRPRVNGKTKSETMKERRAGWQKLAAFRWRQKWP